MVESIKISIEFAKKMSDVLAGLKLEKMSVGEVLVLKGYLNMFFDERLKELNQGFEEEFFQPYDETDEENVGIGG